MSIDDTALEQLRGTLAADDYDLAVTDTDAGVRVRITAGPEACEDCLVPKPLMRGVLQQALGIPEDDITLIYPGED
ncbi:hypothetical protein [Saccharopolyspora flava]|uniref:Fe-S cluster biogenesis protein NfuA, 4Fe-4S-binding domain n=1 Tax=Saccharopolyspora flava TaxID=95161 RepID=A0A1I6SQZ4_9PSEU|nr:hypothetical protein [Saccharopolyspora flava]SFS79319.1 hypothetical protein SAMN05660874_03326 [Saccharopolyspora flava]